MSDMTPREAANGLAFLAEDPRTVLSPAARRAMHVLLDHARATSPAPEGGDLAELARAVRDARDDAAEGKGADAVRPLDDVARHLDRLAAGRLTPAPSVATPPQEGEDDAGLYDRDGNHWTEVAPDHWHMDIQRSRPGRCTRPNCRGWDRAGIERHHGPVRDPAPPAEGEAVDALGHPEGAEETAVARDRARNAEETK